MSPPSNLNPNPSQSCQRFSPLNPLDLKDDQFESLFGEGPSRPVEEESPDKSPVEEVAPVKRKVLEIVDLFHFHGVTHDAAMLRVFPITLSGLALRWNNRLSAGLITTWDLLEKVFIRQYCPPFKTAIKLEKIRNFKQEMDETLYHAWERIPKKTHKELTQMDNDCDIMVKDVERLSKMLTPTIHTLPNLEPVVQPYTPLRPVHDEDLNNKETKFEIISTCNRVPYDCKLTIRSRPFMILFIKEWLSKSSKRLKLFKDTIFGKYLDLDVEDNDNHLLNYVLHHQRPQISKSIDSNLVFDIAGHTLLFRRSEFSSVTGFTCEKLVFPEYTNDGIPPFLRRVFSDKVKNLENKASLGKAAQGKAAKGKAAKGKAVKGKDAKRKTAQGRTVQPSDIGQEDKKVANNSFLRLVEDLAAWDDFSWESEVIPRCLAWTRRKGFEKGNYPELFGPREMRTGVEKRMTMLRVRKDLNRWMTKTGSIVMMNLKLNKMEVVPQIERATSVCYDIDEADAAADDNAKATSVPDDVGVPDAAADDNAKATSVHNDVGVPDAASDDNAKATSVCDDINEADAIADDNAKATSVHGNVGVPDVVADENAKVPISIVYNMLVDNKNVLIKDAHEIINHIDPPIHGFQIMLLGSFEKKEDGLDEAKANHKDTEPEVTVVKKTRNKRMSKRQRELPTPTRRCSKRHIQEVVLTADNGEVVKETQLPDSHNNVEGDSVIRLPACYWKLFEGNPHCALGRESTRDSNTPKTRIYIPKEVLHYLNQAKKPRQWFP
uniref:Phospholipase-like protein n=1 Tax=Tanacetum cinerariifolium TaxID=118510 RepID=A0A6L2NPX5_TANCI|nr:phospholipase-like protein [Tanacetum cinerariifolium]